MMSYSTCLRTSTTMCPSSKDIISLAYPWEICVYAAFAVVLSPAASLGCPVQPVSNGRTANRTGISFVMMLIRLACLPV